MTRLSLRLRSVAAATLAILLALVVVGVIVDLLVGRNLHRSLDRNLRQRAVEVSQLSASAPALLTTAGALDSPLGGTQQLVEVLDRHGRIVARSLSLGGRVLPGGRLGDAAIAHGIAGYADVSLGDEDVRLYAAPLADFGGPAAGGAVVVAASTHDLQRALASLRIFLVAAGLCAAALAGAAVALMMRRALRPLGDLAEGASRIARTGNPSGSLPQPLTRDEVGRLAETLNSMLASLERSRERERRFLADASHELRTPLTSLRGNVAHLARHGATPELVADLEEDAARLAGLADDLLALSREESAATPAEDVRLDALARAAGERAGAEVRAREPVVVRGDRAALERAVANLIENAQLHGPESGRVEISVEQADGKARLTVSDEGAGLGSEEREVAFTRFWRGARAHGRPGSGLGLAIVRATAERHGGHAYAAGSRFTLELPALTELSNPVGTTRDDELEKGSP